MVGKIYYSEILGYMMNLWLQEDWKNYFYEKDNIRWGIYLRINKEVNDDVRKSLKKFAIWLRNNFEFPIRLPIYVKPTKYIKTRYNDYVVGSFFEPENYFTEPYIKLSTGDYVELLNSIGKDNALASILCTLIHEITHYYQWINRVDMSIDDREKEAEYYGDYILEKYAECVDSP